MKFQRRRDPGRARRHHQGRPLGHQGGRREHRPHRDLQLPATSGNGNLGPVDLALGFKPPNGVGLAIDAGVVKGGGYLFFDFDKGEYAGALELTIADFLSLKAIGLITTQDAGRLSRASRC